MRVIFFSKPRPPLFVCEHLHPLLPLPRSTGIWIGDNTGGGSDVNHQTDMSYGWLGVSFQQNTYVTSTSYAVYFRSKSNVGAAKVGWGGVRCAGTE
jgi:hypothetical protein